MPHLKRGWLDACAPGDHLYIIRQSTGFGIPTIDFHRVLITRATKTQIVASMIQANGDGVWEKASMRELVFRRGVGRTEWDPYRGEGEESGDLYRSGRFRCYPITPEFTKYFEGIVEENRVEKMAASMAYQLTNVSKRTWIEYGPVKMKALLDELAEIEKANG